MNNTLRYCETCNGYSAPQVNVDVRGGPNIGPLVVTSEQELRMLYTVKEKYEELQRLQMIAPNDVPNRALLDAQRVDRRTLQHTERSNGLLMEDNARLRESLQSLNRQLADQESAYSQLFHQNSRLKERLENLKSHDTAIGALRSRGLLEDNNRQHRGGEGLLSTDASLILQRINNLERRIQEDSFKIQHMEAIIDMLNRRVQDKDRSFNRLMVMHRTMMKEE